MSKARYDGKVAVITGSSQGIGKAIAIEFAKQDASIVLNGRDPVRLAETESELKKIHGNVISVCCDVSEKNGGQQLIDKAIQRFKQIDFLVNNVGVSMRGNVADLNPDVYKSVFESNVLGSVNSTIPAIKHLRETKGSIVFISSLAGIRGLPALSAYSASKMALRAIAESIRIEEIQNQIHVGLIYVGMTINHSNKKAIAADGTFVNLESRNKNKVLSTETVAKAVMKNIHHREFITVMTSLGKLTLILQKLFPSLVEKIILHNLKKFENQAK